jgi:hypothetical protein
MFFDLDSRAKSMWKLFQGEKCLHSNKVGLDVLSAYDLNQRVRITDFDVIILDKEWQSRTVCLNVFIQSLRFRYFHRGGSACTLLLEALDRDEGDTLDARNSKVEEYLSWDRFIVLGFGFEKLLLCLFQPIRSQLCHLSGNPGFLVALDFLG